MDHISEHLYTRGLPDPDLIIRTSGEQRLSGFMLWQSAHSEFYFCELNWPDFRRVDFLRALRSYGTRQPPLWRLTRSPRSRQPQPEPQPAQPEAAACAARSRSLRSPKPQPAQPAAAARAVRSPQPRDDAGDVP